MVNSRSNAKNKAKVEVNARAKGKAKHFQSKAKNKEVSDEEAIGSIQEENNEDTACGTQRVNVEELEANSGDREKMSVQVDETGKITVPLVVESGRFQHEEKERTAGILKNDKCNNEAPMGVLVGHERKEIAEVSRGEECQVTNVTVEGRRKGAPQVSNEDKRFMIEYDKMESATAVEVRNGEVASTSKVNGDGVLTTAESDAEGYNLPTGSPEQVVANAEKHAGHSMGVLTRHGKEEDQCDGATIGNAVVGNTKKKATMTRKIIKKKLVKRRVPVNKVKEATQSSEVPDAATEQKDEENKDDKAKYGDQVNQVKRVIRKKVLLLQQHVDPVVAKDDGNSIGKGKEVIENLNHMEESKYGDIEKMGSRSCVSRSTGAREYKGKEKPGPTNKKRIKKSEGGASKENTGKGAVENESAKSSRRGTFKVASTGMIFMCTSKTKRDCFQYRVLGLPPGKKDMVLKVYEGMRLFLFDVDTKLLYGIFKAAGPGGYNIEPRAFNSAFPSQVRFTILSDCLPLPEEKFKIAIKDNYFTKNKFNCQLNSEQVKNLCRIFNGSKVAKSTGVGDGLAPLRKPEKRITGVLENEKRDDDMRLDRKRSRAQGNSKVDRKRTTARGDSRVDRKRSRAQDDSRQDRKRKTQDDLRLDTERGKAQDDEKLQCDRSARTVLRNYQPLLIPSKDYPRHHVVYERQVDTSPTAHHTTARLALPPPREVISPSYAYGISSVLDGYRQERALDHRSAGQSYIGHRVTDVYQRRDPYYSSREPVSYIDPYYTSRDRQERYSASSSRTDYYSLLPSREEHLRPPAPPATEYRVPPPPHRRY